MHKRISKKTKFDAAIAMIASTQTIAELTKKYEVCQKTLLKWKNDLLSKGPDLFLVHPPKETDVKEIELKDLRTKVGELTMDIDFLKKTLKALEG